jgi:hypothetical protein
LWRRTVSETNKRLGQQGAYTPALLEEIKGHIEEFRARSGAPAPARP